MALATVIALPARAQTSYPMVTRVQPAAVQRGQTADVTVSGVQNFAGASSLLFEGTGLSATVLGTETTTQPSAKRQRRNPTGSVRTKITVAADAALGPRELRIVTAQGVSSVGLIVVVNDPVAVEADDRADDEPKGAQAIPLPTVISGTIGRVEDVDWYSFHAESGQRLTFSLWGNRLENKIHDLQEHLDPILVLTDSQGRELSADDNHDFADPLLTYVFPQSGTYFLQVRDTTYAGNPNWSYVLHVTPGPYATSVFPMAVHPGATADVRASGFNLDSSKLISLAVPSATPLGAVTFPMSTDRGLTPPAWFVATDLPTADEVGDAPQEALRGQLVSVPCTVSGRLSEPNDEDAFQFSAQKGHSYTIEVLARRVGSAADPVVRILDVKGKLLAEADDTFGKDPRLDWTAPSDGLYALEITDLHSRGRNGFGYVVVTREAKPDFTLACDPDKINIGPGSRSTVFARVERRTGFQGPVQVSWEGLPKGMSTSPLTIPAHMTQGVVVFSAAADAPKGAALITLSGKGETAEGPIVRAGTPKQEIYLPGGGRGLYAVSTLAAAVTDPSDIIVEASPNEVTLRPGASATIDVVVKRRDGFDKPVNLAVDLAHLGQVYGSALPPGVRLDEGASKTLLDPKTNAGKIVLQARPDAPPTERSPIAVMGHVSINFVVKTAYSSAPILVTVPRK
jgi:hypothetical protein